MADKLELNRKKMCKWTKNITSLSAINLFVVDVHVSVSLNRNGFVFHKWPDLVTEIIQL